MTDEVFDEETARPMGAFGLWKPDMDLVVRFEDIGPTDDLSPELQADFIRDLKILALRYCLNVKDWGPQPGMMTKMLMESEDETEPRLRDLESVVMTMADMGDPLPARALPALKRITERVQTR